MKPYTITTAIVAVILMTLAFTETVSAGSNHPCSSAFVTVGCMNWRLEEYDETIETLSLRVEALEADALLVTSVRELEAQQAGLQSTLGEMSALLGQAQAELGRVISATSNINTATAIFTSHRYSSNSMYPTIRYANDLVWLHNPIPGYPLSISVGDVIGSVEPGCTVAHRVTAVVDGGYIVSGDNRDSECFVSEAEVIYKWVAIARNVYWSS